MDRSLPAPARLLGPAGLIPFIGLAIAVWLGWPAAGPALVAYGATILAFLGAVHWGLALRAPEGERWADWARYGLGIVPALIAWVALLLPLPFALALLGVLILAAAGIETLAFKSGLMPLAYLRLRWMLSVTASTALFAAIFGI